MKTEQQIQALQNMANHAGHGLTVHLNLFQDKRRTVQKYFATIDSCSISPVLDYERMNCFLMGFARATGQPAEKDSI